MDGCVELLWPLLDSCVELLVNTIWGLFKFIQRALLISNCQLISKLIVLFMFSFLRLAFQMGKGRTTTGMIVATLMADIAQA